MEEKNGLKAFKKKRLKNVLNVKNVQKIVEE